MRAFPRPGRRTAGALTTLLVAAGLVAVSAAPAQAATEDGVYTGTNSHGYDIEITVENGTVTDVQTTGTTVCYGGGVMIPFPTAFMGAPNIPIDANGRFEANWTYQVDQYATAHYWIGGTISGDVIESSGSNAADVVQDGTLCSGTQFSYTAEREQPPAPVYDPQVSVSPTEMTVEEMSTDGIDLSVSGFPPNARIAVHVGPNDSSLGTTDEDGEWQGDYRSTAYTPGTYEVYARAVDMNLESPRVEITIDPDPVVVYEPEVTVDPSSVTVSELASEGVEVSVTGMPPGDRAYVDFDGEYIAPYTYFINPQGGLAFTFEHETTAGPHELTVRSGDWEATTTLTVEADAAPVYDPEVTVNPDELTVSELASTGISVEATGLPEDAAAEVLFDGEVVDSPQTSATGSIEQTYYLDAQPGEHEVVVRSDQWEASATVTVDADPVVYDPEVSLDLSEITVSGLAEDGIVVTGSGFPEDAAAEVLFDGDVVAGATTSSTGELSETVSVDGAQPGDHEVLVRSGQWEASATLIVEADPVVYDPEVTLDLSEITVSGLAEDGILITGTGFPAGAEIEVLLDGEPVADDEVTPLLSILAAPPTQGDGSFAFRVVLADVAPGPHTLEVSAGGQSAQASFDVVADAVTPAPGDDDPAPGDDDEPGQGGGSGGGEAGDADGDGDGLATTGAELPLGLGLLTVLLLGAGALMVIRRRTA